MLRAFSKHILTAAAIGFILTPAFAGSFIHRTLSELGNLTIERCHMKIFDNPQSIIFLPKYVTSRPS
jgi:hypothetical protein